MSGIQYTSHMGGKVGGRLPQETSPLAIFETSLPIPPSVNNSFVNAAGKGRVKSADYTAWLARAGHKLGLVRYRTKDFKTIDFAVSVVIEVERSNAQRDLDNCIKPILDALQKSKIIKNDNLVSSIFACWSPGVGADSEATVALFPAGWAPAMSFVPTPKNVSVGYVEYLTQEN